MNDVATKTDLKVLGESLDKKIDKAVEDLSNIIGTFAQQVDERFNKVEADIQILNQKYDHLVRTIDGFVARIDRYETELAARDHKIDRLERWIEEIAKSTGVKLSV